MKRSLSSYNDCTGCGACFASCNQNAISFRYDRNGFLRPFVNSEKCTDCGLCTKKCPVLKIEELPFHEPSDLSCYTSWTKDDELCVACTSGGVATQLAIEFLRTPKSIYYGAAVDEGNTCKHIAVTSNEELKRTIGTKYIQSNASWALSDARQKIKQGYRVLFSGTPCQIAAVYSVIPKTLWQNLYTMELICHGAPSQKVAQMTADYYGCKSLVEYRTKKEGWFVDGKKVANVLKLQKEDGSFFFTPKENFFGKTYAIYNNISCFDCKFAKPYRVADIILGDQWGLAKCYPERAYKGASSVIVSSEKGRQLLCNCKDLYVEKNSMSTINAPMFFRSHRSSIGRFLSKRVYLLDKLPSALKFEAMKLNWRKCPFVLPILIWRKIADRNNGSELQEIMNMYRTKYNWK